MSIEILTDKQIEENFEKYAILADTITEQNPDRQSKIRKIISDYESELATAPASANYAHHNSFIGGYVDHVLRVCEYANGYYNFLQDNGMKVIDEFSLEELLFAAMHHDLGKLGLINQPYYVPNDSQWHIKNQGKIYNYNSELSHMSVPDRSLFILQSYGIDLTINEYNGIKLHDGLYDDANKGYYMTYNPDQTRNIYIAIVLHNADHLATIQEKSMYKGIIKEKSLAM